MFRDWRLSGFRQSNAGWEGGGHPHAYPRDVPMHSHTQHPFIADGRIAAYETSPRFDYALGDATNSWPLDDVREAYRQMVYVRPDVIVVYDRLLLGEKPKGVKWPMLTMGNKLAPGGNPALSGEVFTTSDKIASLWGRAMLPKGGKINSTCGYLEICPPAKTRQVEFLVVLRTGLIQPAPLDCKLVEQGGDSGQAGAAFAYEGRNYTVLFSRQGPPSGHVKIEEGGKTTLDRPLADGIRDSYENWKGTPLFDQWMHQERFKPYITPEDLARFGGEAK